MDLKCFLLLAIVSVSVESIDGQMAQCTTDEYRTVVLSLEALRAQFRTLQAEAAVEISNLVTIIRTMHETIQSLLPEPEIISSWIHFCQQVLNC